VLCYLHNLRARERRCYWLTLSLIGHFTVVCSVTWTLNGSKAGGDLALMQTSLFLSWHLVSIRTTWFTQQRSPPASPHLTLIAQKIKLQPIYQNQTSFPHTLSLKRSRWPPIFISFLKQVNHYLSAVEVTKKFYRVENFRTKVLIKSIWFWKKK